MRPSLPHPIHLSVVLQTTDYTVASQEPSECRRYCRAVKGHQNPAQEQKSEEWCVSPNSKCFRVYFSLSILLVSRLRTTNWTIGHIAHSYVKDNPVRKFTQAGRIFGCTWVNFHMWVQRLYQLVYKYIHIIFYYIKLDFNHWSRDYPGGKVVKQAANSEA